MLWTLMLGSLAMPKLAVVARVYFPYPDKRVSYQRLYVMDWSGRNLKTVSLTGQECEAVMWAGPDRLVYEVALKNKRFKSAIWTINLRDRKPRLLLSEGNLDKEVAFDSAGEGVAVIYSAKSQPLTVDAKSGRLMPLRLRPNPWLDPFKGPDRAFVSKAIRSSDASHPGTFTIDPDNKGILETAVGRVSMDVQIWFGVHDPRTNRLWAIDHPSMHSERLHRVRWETGRVEQLFWAGYSFDWRPDRKAVAFATQRDLSPYGPVKTVWTNELWVGELETGAQRQLKLPMAWFADVAVSPAK